LENTQADTPRVNVRPLLSLFILASVSIGGVEAMRQMPTPPSQPPETRPLLTPSEIDIYKSAPTLIDWSLRQIHDCAFLHKLQPAKSQDQLPEILNRVGQTCTSLFHDFPKVSCDEEVESVASVPYSRVRRKFHYIVAPRPIGDLPAFEEYRTDLKGIPLDVASLWNFSMITSNYVSSFLYLSPADQHDNRFRYLGIQMIRERACHVVGFAQDPERVRRIAEFMAQGKSVVLLYQGLAWIDPQTFQILRVTTWLLAPRSDVGLSVQTTTIDFYPVQSSETERVLWLPRDVEVKVLCRGMKIRNTHCYSDFKVFRVESKIKP